MSIIKIMIHRADKYLLALFILVSFIYAYGNKKGRQKRKLNELSLIEKIRSPLLHIVATFFRNPVRIFIWDINPGWCLCKMKVSIKFPIVKEKVKY